MIEVEGICLDMMACTARAHLYSASQGWSQTLSPVAKLKKYSSPVLSLLQGANSEMHVIFLLH